jgi:hypothetical protein
VDQLKWKGDKDYVFSRCSFALVCIAKVSGRCKDRISVGKGQCLLQSRHRACIDRGVNESRFRLDECSPAYYVVANGFNA